MNEPTELGAVISARIRGEATLSRWTHCGSGIWVRESDGRRVFWYALTDHELLCPGYTPPLPPTPEPDLPYAVVRDAEGDVMWRIRQGEWYVPNIGVITWSEVAPPVEVLFSGVPE